MDQESLDFFQGHSERFLEMVFRNGKREVIQTPDGYGRKTRECGDTVEIFLIVRNGQIRSASFQTHGCIYTVACANTVIHMVEGKSLEQAGSVSEEDVVDYLETLPVGERHCAQLVVRALRNALQDVEDMERQPWRKFYPRRK
jgi:nitrogen fixation NifU-like protein